MAVTLQSATRDNGTVILVVAVDQPQPPPDPISGIVIPVGPRLVTIILPLAVLASLNPGQKKAYVLQEVKAIVSPPQLGAVDTGFNPGDVLNLP